MFVGLSSENNDLILQLLQQKPIGGKDEKIGRNEYMRENCSNM